MLFQNVRRDRSDVVQTCFSFIKHIMNSCFNFNTTAAHRIETVLKAMFWAYDLVGDLNQFTILSSFYSFKAMAGKERICFRSNELKNFFWSTLRLSLRFSMKHYRLGRKWCHNSQVLVLEKSCIFLLMIFEAIDPEVCEAEHFARCSLIIARCSLLFARCSLLSARCSLLFACCSLLFACCPLLFARCSLLFARCSLLFARCSLLSASYSLLFACCSLLFTCCSRRNSEAPFFCLNKSKQRSSPC